MSILLAVGVLLFFTSCIDITLTESSTGNSLTVTQSLKTPLKDYVSTTSTWETLNSLWAYHHISHTAEEATKQKIVFHQPHSSQTSLTRLAKTLSSGLNPYFQKEYFEPFEKRPHPVTLVGIRKNGLFPRDQVKQEIDKSAEIAELQSPYNDMGSVWMEEPVKE